MCGGAGSSVQQPKGLSREEGGFVRGLESSEEELEAGKVGRPPLDKGAGAMSPEALKVRKRKLMKD